MTIRIVTDSSCDLPSGLIEQYGISVLPCYVVVDDQTFKDGLEIQADDFYRRLLADGRTPTTAQPTPSDFQTVYRELVGQGDQIISIHVSSKLSGTLNSAQQAKASLDDGSAVEIIDSQLASIPLGLAVLDAAIMASKGGSVYDIAGRVRQSLGLHHGLFALDTLEYLQKGGRIGKAQAFVGSILNVKPILGLEDGAVLPIERARNLQRGLRRLLELAHQEAPLTRLAVIHSTDPLMARGLRQELSDLLPEDQIISARFGATLGTYIGPGGLGVALIRAG